MCGGDDKENVLGSIDNLFRPRSSSRFCLRKYNVGYYLRQFRRVKFFALNAVHIERTWIIKN